MADGAPLGAYVGVSDGLGVGTADGSSVGAMDGARRADLALLRTMRDFGSQIQRGEQAGRGETDEAAGIVEEEREAGAGSQAARYALQRCPLAQDGDRRRQPCRQLMRARADGAQVPNVQGAAVEV